MNTRAANAERENREQILERENREQREREQQEYDTAESQDEEPDDPDQPPNHEDDEEDAQNPVGNIPCMTPREPPPELPELNATSVKPSQLELQTNELQPERGQRLLNQRRGHKSVITNATRKWDDLMVHPHLHEAKHITAMNQALISAIKAIGNYEEITIAINSIINLCFDTPEQMDENVIESSDYIESVHTWIHECRPIYEKCRNAIYVRETFTQKHNRYPTGTSHGITPKSALRKVRTSTPATFSTGQRPDPTQFSYSGHMGHIPEPNQSIQTVIPDPNFPAGRKVVKLPPVHVPSFDGDYTKWENFFDMFVANVDQNDSLSDIVKLTYLKSYLIGDAAKVLLSVKATDANYQRALRMVRDRFSNPRVIVNNHLRELMNLPFIKGDSGHELMTMIDTVKHSLFCIEQQGVQVEHWDLIVIYQITSRLPPLVKEKWEYESDGVELQRLESLFRFMTRQARSTSHGGSSTKNIKPETKTGKVLTNNVVISKCYACNGPQHKHITECASFAKKPTRDQYSIGRRMSLCYQCLCPGHRSDTCTEPKCEKCGGAHHVMLHQDRFMRRDQQPALAENLALNSISLPMTITSPIRAFSSTIGHNPGAMALGQFVAILPTVKLHLVDSFGCKMTIRALLDTGSQGNFVTEHVAHRLGMSRTKVNVRVDTMERNSELCSKSLVTIDLPNVEGYPGILALETLVMSHITASTPQRELQLPVEHFPVNVQLADTAFNKPARIDVLLGIIMVNYLTVDGCFWKNGVKYQNTRLGYVASGVCEIDDGSNRQNISPSINHLSACQEDVNVMSTQFADISHFWEMEDLPSPFDLNGIAILKEGKCMVQILTPDEQAAQDHFDRTTIVRPDGRYVVDLPMKEGAPPLGNSARQALKRFHNLEQFKFAKNEKHREQYRAAIAEFKSLNYLVPVPEHLKDLPEWLCYHMAHHYVLKDSTTTALRVVYDGSMSTSTGVSLNDTLHKGPKIQRNLYDQLLKLRRWEVAIIGDVAKMYLQVELSPTAQNYHRIFWRDTPDDPIELLQMTRVTYGVTSSGYHAVRVLNELAADCENEQARRSILEDMYVDDCMTGADNVEQAETLLNAIRNHLAKKLLVIRKWCSNSPQLIANLPECLRENDQAFTVSDTDHTVKALGMKWLPIDDWLIFTVDHVDLGVTKFKTTKRQLLSDISKLYDPMGLISPVIVTLKLLMQSSWIQKIEWDKPLPPEICETFHNFREKLVELRKLRIPRKILPNADPQVKELHVFCDASEKAYAACVYVRAGNPPNMTVKLLTSKSKVAPLKAQSIARLELCAMLLGAKLVCAAVGILKSVNLSFDQVYGWTDSAVALCWVNGHSRKWLPFVANRVSMIHQLMSEHHWHHVGTLDNPADLASRGIEPAEIVENELWWHGPWWLNAFLMPDQPEHLNADYDVVNKEERDNVFGLASLLTPEKVVMVNSELELFDPEMFPEDCYPIVSMSCFQCNTKTRNLPNVIVDEFIQGTVEKDVVVPNTISQKARNKAVDWHPKDQDELWNLYDISGLPKTLRQMGFVFKFLSSFKKFKESEKFGGVENLPENTATHQFYRHKSLQFLIRREQEKYYAKELKVLRWEISHREKNVTPKSIATTRNQIMASSKIVSLYPLLDDDGVLKVGGRLAQADFITEDQMYPAILPHESRLAKLIVQSAHLKSMHGSVQVTMSYVRSSVWIVGLRGLVRNHIGNCVRCFRFNSRRNEQLMGDLPRERVSPSPPFTYTGIDFSGAINVRMGSDVVKAYLAVFVCFSTKAIHIEVVSRMDAESCAACLRRFVARRGTPARFFSDNGTNFVGARSELIKITDVLAKSNDPMSMVNIALELGSAWSMIPAVSPHWGGLWEAGVKQAKFHLRKVIGRNVLSYEELSTLTSEIESMLNTRPLCEMTDDPNDLRVLTPGSLLLSHSQRFLPDRPHEKLVGNIPPDVDRPDDLKRRWQWIQRAKAEWWKRWTKDYLPSLQTRKKWHKERPDLKVGDIVLITDDDVRQYKWPVGRVVEAYVGNDSRCRSAKVKSEAGLYVRPIVKLRKLPIE